MGANPAAHLCLRVGSRHQVTFVPFPRRSPLFVIAAGSAQVSLTLPDQLDAEHVEFARHLASPGVGVRGGGGTPLPGPAAAAGHAGAVRPDRQGEVLGARPRLTGDDGMSSDGGSFGSWACTSARLMDGVLGVPRPRPDPAHHRAGTSVRAARPGAGGSEAVKFARDLLRGAERFAAEVERLHTEQQAEGKAA